MSLEKETPKKVPLTLEQLGHLRSWTIEQWCTLRSYSRPFYYTLKRTGDAPDVIGAGKAQRITAEEDARWRKRQEAKARKRAKAG